MAEKKDGFKRMQQLKREGRKEEERLHKQENGRITEIWENETEAIKAASSKTCWPCEQSGSNGDIYNRRRFSPRWKEMNKKVNQVKSTGQWTSLFVKKITWSSEQDILEAELKETKAKLEDKATETT